MSATRKSVLILTNTGNEFNFTGEQVKADSWFGYTDGLHTIQVTYHNFTGGFGIQGTLALEPKPEDWFWIQLVDARGNCNKYPYLTYPKDELAPTGSPSAGIQKSQGDSGTEAFTFVGNFTFLRAMLTRDYIEPIPMPETDGRFFLGQIDRVLLSL